MKKTLKKLAATVLAAAFTCGALGGLAACDGNKDPGKTPVVPIVPSTGSEAAEKFDELMGDVSDLDEYEKSSLALYKNIYAEYYVNYDLATKAKNRSERYALMAVAEAKMLEAYGFIPTSSNGGNYAISRVAPGTAPDVLWGTDAYRYSQAVLATDLIKAADRDALKAARLAMKSGVDPDDATSKGHAYKGSDYSKYVKDYLTAHGYTISRTFNNPYTGDPKTWDIHDTYRQTDSEAILNLYDGLLQYDELGKQQPALAESYTVSEDQKTYTFKIRQGVKWVNNQGTEVASVKADDFVAGFQHMLDCSPTTYLGGLVSGVVKGAAEYLSGEITNFADVGVKATDDSTLVIELEEAVPYFTSMLTYNTFAPLCRTYYESKGGKFGAEFNKADSSYTYGKTYNDVVSCGPYVVTSYTKENSIVFSKNASYWNKDNVNVDTINWKFYGSNINVSQTYNDAKAGIINGAGLNATTLGTSKTDGTFDTYVYVSGTDATCFQLFYNVQRAAFSLEDGTVASAKTDDEKVRFGTAIQNVHFRAALSHGVDRVPYNAATTTADTAKFSLINSLTPGNFVTLEEPVTISFNGEDKSFPAGTNYGEIVQTQLDADGSPIVAWQYNEDTKEYSSSGFDGWYNVTAAKAELDKAITELAEQGVEISAAKPIVMDMPYTSFHEIYVARAQAYKQSLEATFEGKIKVNLIDCGSDADTWSMCGYYTDFGYECNYDLYDNSGWGPDYGDPASYLNIFLPFDGDMIKMLGIF